MKTQEMPRVGDRVEAQVNDVWMPVVVTRSFSSSFHAKCESETYTGLKIWRLPSVKPELPKNSHLTEPKPEQPQVCSCLCLYELDEIPLDKIQAALKRSPQCLRELAVKLGAEAYCVLQGLRVLAGRGHARSLTPQMTDSWLLPDGDIDPPQVSDYSKLEEFKAAWRHWVEAGGDTQEEYEDYQHTTAEDIWESVVKSSTR